MGPGPDSQGHHFPSAILCAYLGNFILYSNRPHLGFSSGFYNHNFFYLQGPFGFLIVTHEITYPSKHRRINSHSTLSLSFFLFLVLSSQNIR